MRHGGCSIVMLDVLVAAKKVGQSCWDGNLNGAKYRKILVKKKIYQREQKNVEVRLPTRKQQETCNKTCNGIH